MDFFPFILLYFKDRFPFTNFVGKMEAGICVIYEKKCGLPYHSERKLKVKA